MSHTNVVKFLEKISGDTELRTKFQSIYTSNVEQASKEIIRVASDSGYDFEESELEELCLAQAASEIKQETGKEFSPDELHSVARDGKVFKSPGALNAMEQQFETQSRMLQQASHTEQRHLSVLSTIIKAKHDTARSILKHLK